MKHDPTCEYAHPNCGCGEHKEEGEEAPKKQTTRMLKCECPQCGYTVRTTRKWLDVAVPVCPVHGHEMELEGVEE